MIGAPLVRRTVPCAGIVRGAAGIRLSRVSVALIAAVVELDYAIALSLLPWTCRVSRRPKCSFRPLSVRKRQSFSSPVLSGGGTDCRTR